MKNTRPQTIELHPLSPPKPDYGAHCNGCGMCCAAEPCPVAMIFLLQFRVKCRALIWQEEMGRYVCGMAVCPDRYMRIIPLRWRDRSGKFFASRIAAGTGCDFAAEVLDADR